MDYLLGTINKDLYEYYVSKMASGEISPEKVGWKDKQAQLKRFDQLVKIIDRNTAFSLNDLGCGLGDFSQYLAAKGFNNFSYYGYDVFDIMIDGAKQIYGSSPIREFTVIGHSKEMRIADYTVASGVFNLKFTVPNDKWLDYVLAQLSILNAKSTRAFAFNALTKYSDPEFMKGELYYADPCLLFDYCKRNISRNVALLHDYGEFDFTILVRKK